MNTSNTKIEGCNDRGRSALRDRFRFERHCKLEGLKNRYQKTLKRLTNSLEHHWIIHNTLGKMVQYDSRMETER